MDPPSEELVARWLSGLGMPEYLQSFVDNGYDDLVVCREIGADDLDAIGVTLETDRAVILEAVDKLRSRNCLYTELERDFFPLPSFDAYLVERSASFLLEKFNHTTEAEARGDHGVFQDAGDGVELSSAWIGDEAGKTWQARVPPSSLDDDDNYKMFSVYGQSARSSSPPSHHLSIEDRFGEDVFNKKTSVKSLDRNSQEIAGTQNPGDATAEEEEEEEEEDEKKEERRKDQGLKDQLLGTLTKIFRSLSFKKRSPKKFVYEQHRGDLKASEMMMGERERMNLMLQVKSGKMSVFEAVQRVNSYRCKAPSNNCDNNNQQQHMAKSRSMDEQNLVQNQHHHHHHHRHRHHHHHQQHRDLRCHEDRSATTSSSSPFATRKFEHLPPLPLLPVHDRNRNQAEFPLPPSSGKTQKSSPPPLPPPSAIISSLSAERLHPSRDRHRYRNDEEEDDNGDGDDDDDDDNGDDARRMSANYHPPDVLAGHPTYHNYRRLYRHHNHHHHHPHQHHPLPHLHPHRHHLQQLRHIHRHDDDDDGYRCPLCSVRKSRSLHLAAPRGEGSPHAPHSPHSRAWVEWDSSEELKTLKFLKQCTAERLKSPCVRMLRAQDERTSPALLGDIDFQRQATPDCLPPAYQRLAFNPHFAFHSLYQQYHYHHHRRQHSLPSSSSSSCDGWTDVKSDTRSFQGQGSGTMVDLFKRIGLQHLTEKFLAGGKSSLDELMELKGDDLTRLGVRDEMDRVKLLTVAQFMLDCHQYFGSVQTVRSQSPAVAQSRDVSSQTANGIERS